MKMKRNSFLLVMLLGAVFFALLSGCSNESAETLQNAEPPKESSEQRQNQPEPEEVQEQKEPATVRFSSKGWFTDEEFERLIMQPVAEQAPYITVEVLEGTIDAQLNAGEIPDIIITHNGVMLEYSDRGLMSDLNELVKKHQLDLDRFDPSVLESLTYEGKLMAVPFAVNFTALYYNTDIFDMFGVEYPPDGMTWDDVIELAARVSREHEGVSYRGLDLETPGRFLRVMGLDTVDYRTNKALVNSEDFRTILDITHRVFSIPGNRPASGNVAGNINEFFSDKTVAMLATTNRFFQLFEADRNGLNWDVAQYPSIPGRENIGTDVDAHLFAVPVTAPNRDAAVELIKIVTSDEIQMIMTRETARLSPLKDPVFAQNFAKDLELAKGKNIEGIFKSRRIPAPIRSVYSSDANRIFLEQVQLFVDGAKDANTALRDAEEAINQFIASNPR